mgnify:CR=1 FL=1
MRYIDLFSGIGGFALGLRQAGIEFEEHWFSEIDKNAINIYKKHFPNAKELGDVRAIRDFSGIKADIITFGFPCQDLSVAGKRRGLAGDRSGLFFEAMRIIRELKPQYFIFENVKGLLTNNRGADFVRCLREIADIGLYECEWQLVNTSWVLPQNRERVYFVGHLGGKSGAKVFPLSCGNKKADGIQGQCANSLTCDGYTKIRQASYVVESQQSQKVRQINRTEKNHQQDRVYSPEGICPALNTVGGGNLEPKIVVYPRGNNKGGVKNVSNCPTITGSSFECNTFICPVLTPERENKRQNGRRIKENGEPSFTLTTQDRHGVLTGHIFKDYETGEYFYDPLIRKLTPLECERLQGFPDGWTEYGADGRKMSDSARYKALGNTVTVNFPRMIGEKLR